GDSPFKAFPAPERPLPRDAPQLHTRRAPHGRAGALPGPSRVERRRTPMRGGCPV
ncbi:MAG: hypothetical protein AVDCRST_MAG89-3594, partial [uncultured Gemmatimonadetes bacterium]